VAQDGGWKQAILELWLGMVSVIDVSVRVVAHTDGSRKIALFGISRQVW